MELSSAVILLCLVDATLGIRDIKPRDVQATSQSRCSVTSTLLDILKNDLKRLEDRYDVLQDVLKNDIKDLKQNNKKLESRYDDLVNKYAKLLQATTTLQVKFANFTAENQGASGRDCAELYKNGVKLNGVYTITPDNSPNAFNVYCDMTTDGGGWTLFQKRMDGSVDFYRGWQSYKHGFGNLNGEHWLGDSLKLHKGYAFTTKDRDNDAYARNCAQEYKGAWWYDNCHHSNLNGLYHLGDHSSYADGVNWKTFKGHYHSLKTTEMKVRPVGFKAASSSSG
ncbi:fibrinogen C domain-containing protein 1 isoform X2 [Lingula anatina]|uniref:Fibrinogen C domain-containing protein 1 isoform X2 n=1 Tax=Lingula anatina TaxID=7574 RepID=A0A1S3IK77_LINAN|nr:fibrinogen C domain-containing protein 1 isoform X2 [Lingula anatina]|eukprot:XP_013398612.1 fibrinogen C domain-containing protein 1 isoform X2 [Lingula anatina]